MPELTSELLVKTLGGGVLGLAGVRVVFQDMGLGNSIPRHSNQVYPNTILSGVASVADPVAIYLK